MLASVGAATGATRHPGLGGNDQETAVNKDQVKGRLKKAGGKVEEVAGRIVGDKFLEQKGKYRKNVGAAQAGYGDMKNKLKKIG